MATALSLITSLIGAVFMLAVLAQYLSRRRPHQLVWAVGLGLYTAGVFLWFLREAAHTYEVVFRLWYLTGAMLAPAYLGTGTLWLLAPGGTFFRWPPRGLSAMLTWLLLLISIVAAVLALTASLRSPLSDLPASHPLTARDPVTGESFFPAYVVVLTILLNTYGTILLVGGALWSLWLAWRGRAPSSEALAQQAGEAAGRRLTPQAKRAATSILIAIGAILPALGGSLETTSIPQPHLWMLLIGLVVILLGFLMSLEPRRQMPTAQS